MTYAAPQTDELDDLIAGIDIKDGSSWDEISDLWHEFPDDPRVERLRAAYENEHGPVHDWSIWAGAETPFADNH